jgi:hypothetical protein
MTQDIQQVKWKVLEAGEDVFVNSLRDGILTKNNPVVQYVLKHINVPDEVLNYKVLKNTTTEILITLLMHKLKTDTFVNDFNENNNELEQYVSNDKILSYNNLYKMYFLLKLCNENNFNYNDVKYCNVFINYKSAMYFVDKIFCDSIYYANFEFLNQFYDCTNTLNILPIFKPQDRASHQQILKWIITNLENIEMNKPVGWRSGPDSGEWPSDKPEDYKKIIEFLNGKFHIWIKRLKTLTFFKCNPPFV